MAWVNPPDWTTGQVVTAADLDQYITDNTNYLKAFTDGIAGADAEKIVTEDSTTSVSLVDAHPDVTVTIGATGLCLVGFSCYFRNTLAGGRSVIGYRMEGSNVQAASVPDGRIIQGIRTNLNVVLGHVNLETGLSPGSTTFVLQLGTYSSADRVYIGNRKIWAIPLG